MDRLRHSYPGQLRAMQLSKKELFVFVEGKHSDRFFYGKVCSASINQKIRYEISTADQFAECGAGKQVLISFFSYLRKRDSLVSSFKGKKTACIFFVDKDLDDLLRKKKRSPHLVYTQYYDVENYIFQHGNLVDGVSSAASLEPNKLEERLSDPSTWCRKIANLWGDWIALCLRMIEDGVSCEANYSVPSRVQTTFSGPTDPDKYALLITELASRIKVSPNVFKKRLNLTRKKVNRYLAREEHHSLFKGKWYARALEDEVSDLMKGISYDSNGLARRITPCVAATLDFSQDWTDYFKEGLQTIIEKL